MKDSVKIREKITFLLCILLLGGGGIYCASPQGGGGGGLARDMPFLYNSEATLKSNKGRRSIRSGAKIDFGDRLEVSREAGATVVFPDGSSIRLASGSELELLDGRNSIFWLRLRKGIARITVAPWGWRDDDPEHNKELRDTQLSGNQAFRLRYVLQTPWATLGVRTETRFVEAVVQVVKHERKRTIFTHLFEPLTPQGSVSPSPSPSPTASYSPELTWDITDIQRVDTKSLEGVVELAKDEMSLITIGGRKLRKGEGLSATEVRLGDTQPFGIQEFLGTLPRSIAPPLSEFPAK